jgi:hypothetical protein
LNIVEAQNVSWLEVKVKSVILVQPTQCIKYLQREPNNALHMRLWACLTKCIQLQHLVLQRAARSKFHDQVPERTFFAVPKRKRCSILETPSKSECFDDVRVAQCCQHIQFSQTESLRTVLTK